MQQGALRTLMELCTSRCFPVDLEEVELEARSGVPRLAEGAVGAAARKPSRPRRSRNDFASFGLGL